MLTEAREAPALAASALREDAALYADLGRAFRQRAPRFVATVARGADPDHPRGLRKVTETL
jgi:fructoselysine-6-P-deglycase FrlB-like protein